MWYKGYTERRWERMLIGQDAGGMLRVLRPVLDLLGSILNDPESARQRMTWALRGIRQS